MKNIEKILLINPPGSSYFQPDGSKQAKQCPPPLGLAYLSAQISSKHDVKIYDMLIENCHQERTDCYKEECLEEAYVSKRRCFQVQ